MMRLILLSFLALSCSKSNGGTNPPVPVDTSVKVRVKVLSYNIRRGIPMTGTAIDLQGTADVIKSIQPDLVALSEVDRYTKRSGATVDQAKELGRLTGMYSYFTKAMAYDGGEYGDAVLSRFPILDSLRLELPIALAGSEPRSVAMITVEAEGMKFNFAATHLDHLGAEDNRILQANRLVKDLTQNPLVLAGDLNALPTSQTIGILKQQFTMGCLNCAYTFPSDKPDRTIDYIMFKPANHFRVISYGPVTGKLASDHLPLVAILQMTKK
ncbi:endonuclease/exonuclease/phosphatase family protein [Chitinophaga niabensis]|uniref:Metal-dependent hydrolase, endonuclease/exonuclease/phosphatase family n=1 Tax=Chitinophaga niabensis TaxID=536979 RepID=A0A1N6GR50_9BACT|nr:endonuclease/exonuclease/phosphatase family protein [Chitinophaga niabensis]SIO10014.1 Metal-dependent hydrolase, endonuclease/exonuclease/phosphatase family [Chitinophaga niabensis]